MTRTKRDRLQNLLSLAMIALAVAAVVKELRTPQSERTWNGKVAAVVPYDFRMPTVARARERLWNPESDTFVGPRVFGVGWTVNMGKVYETIKRIVVNPAG